jgi:hypothetical protein
MQNERSATVGNEGTARAAEHPITAIDILLEPDATMVQHAQAANAGLLKNFPKGFSLDNEHRPHISVAGGYFYTAALDKLFEAAGRVLAGEKVTNWKLNAFKYYYMPLKGIGLGGILVEPTADLVRLQKELFDTIAPFAAPAGSGSAAAYATTPQDPDINQATLDAVATYFPAHTGEHYSPHVTIGVGTIDYLDALLAAPFPTFTFSPVGASVYQFGNFGTAMKLLHSFKLTR